MKLKYVAGLAVVILAPLAVVYGGLRASLPRLDGAIEHLGVTAPVTIDRDVLGVPTIQAANRVDLAYATGFVHGQDRFFQMDLSRRLAAGELSELVGEAALEQDRKARIFLFRQVAREVVEQSPPEQRAVLQAYARGVNAGLASLSARPWEYWLLRSVPAAWRPEDTVLVSHAMWWDLQYSGLKRAIVRREINEHLGGAECASGWQCNLQFLYPARTEWDAPNAPVGVVNPGAGGASGQPAGAPLPPPSAAVPPAEVLNVRGAASGAFPEPLSPRRDVDIGSNNWAVAGRLTTTGAALVANDMHLRGRVPAVWYRARLRVAATTAQAAIDLNGVTLPGAPLLVAGSNGRVAWGFTNSYGDWFHVEGVDCTSVGDHEVQTPSGPIALTVRQEEIRVAGKPSVMLSVKSTPAGVLFAAHPDRKACWFVTWLAQQPAATNMNLMQMEQATSVNEVLAVAPGLGIPHQNLVVGDRDGHIAWTIAGRIPVDTGVDRANGGSAWTTPQSHPHVVDPEVGRVWTANARATDDSSQESMIGGSDATVGADYDLGARAHQIRDDLLAIRGAAAPADMLRIQLDDRAVFLTRWQTMLTGLLDADGIAGHPARAEFKRLIGDWNARASVDAVGYRLVRAYRDRTEEAVWRMMLAALKVTPEEDIEVPAQFESALWQLITTQPPHMLAHEYRNWKQFLLVQVDGTIAELGSHCTDLARCTWGSRKPVRIRHPLSGSLPFLAGYLDMPTVALPGDHDMPRVQDGPIGASERFAVSPGHEDQGYIHIPGGQSGHPLSPYYKAGFMNWAQGTPAPFLPGASQHRLTLQPE